MGGASAIMGGAGKGATVNKDVRETAIVDALDRLGPSTLHKLGEELGIDQTTLSGDLTRLMGAKVLDREENPQWRNGSRGGLKHIWRLT